MSSTRPSGPRPSALVRKHPILDGYVILDVLDVFPTVDEREAHSTYLNVDEALAAALAETCFDEVLVHAECFSDEEWESRVRGNRDNAP